MNIVQYASSLPSYASEWLKRKVGQVVLVVVDALRADFVMPGNMVFGNVIKQQQQRPKIQRLHELVQDQPNNPMVNAFVARANAPTVTMPRIKVSFMFSSWHVSRRIYVHHFC